MVETMQQAVLMAEREWKHRSARARRTGTYLRSITHRVTIAGDMVVGHVGSAVPQARWLEEGTGLYGPRHQWIVPRRAKALRFPAGGGMGHAGEGFRLTGQQRSGAAGAGARWVYARRVRGIRPRRYAHDAAFVVQPRVLNLFQHAGLRMAQAVGSVG
jgi:hypothetical protein